MEPSKNVKDKIMGNPQVTEVDKAWLAGIWDGEGTFGIYQYRKTAQGDSSYCARLTLSNTDDVMIQNILRIFKTLGINVNVWRATKARKATHKLEIHITVDKQKSVADGVNAMRPYLVSKARRASILLKFLDYRALYKRSAIRDPSTGRILGIRRQGYRPEEIALYNELRDLNQVGVKLQTPQRLYAKPALAVKI